MGIYKAAAISVVAVCLVLLVKQQREEYALMLALAAGIFILSLALSSIKSVVEFISTLADTAGINSKYAGILLKSLGICVVTELAAEVCRDFGQAGIAAKVELAGGVAILAMSLPMFEALLGLTTELLR